MSETEIQSTKDAIEEIISNGVDLLRPMDIDFFVAFNEICDAEAFANHPNLSAFKTSVEKDENTNSITCYCTITLMLNINTILEIELLLQTVALKYHGQLDGFGTYGNL